MGEFHGIKESVDIYLLRVVWDERKKVFLGNDRFMIYWGSYVMCCYIEAMICSQIYLVGVV